MGSIIETRFHDTVEKISGFHKDLINNSFYTLNDKKPSIVTYFNINREASSLDPSAKITHDNIGKYSSLRYNRISDFIIYGYTRIELQTENDEFGLEADKISGEAYIMPNTIVPYEGDFFEVDHIKDSTWLFMITDVQRDTLDNGSNVYKITYKLEYTDHDDLMKNIVDDYKLIEKREGTNISRVVLNKNLEIAKRMDKIAVKLKKYYNELFYSEYVQTFIYMDLTEWRVYDPYMIEFLIRHKILDNGSDSYIHVCHQLEVEKTFTINYDETIFRAFEKRDRSKVSLSKFTIGLEEIFSYGTTFANRFETYFKARYIDPVTGYTVQCLSDEIINRITDNALVEYNDEAPLWINILIKYFSEEDYTEDELVSADEIKFDTSVSAFYSIPLLILCLEYSIEKALS